eukprot:GFUD01027022.1.p1 GENE.GFUD01027022.1~~GFUD01027022.1.p1  ORF type:complete len:219 (+),score=76.26 GFUD01027022.1:245-901(+)
MRAGQMSSKGRRLTVGLARGEEEGRWSGQRSSEQQQAVAGVEQETRHGPGKLSGAGRLSTQLSPASANQRTGHPNNEPATNQQIRAGFGQNCFSRTFFSPSETTRVSKKQSPRPAHPSNQFLSPPVPQSPHYPPIPDQYRPVSSPGPSRPTSCLPSLHPPLTQSSPNSSPLPPPHDLVSFSCSPYQPLPLVFPIYYMDTFYMSTIPLPPGYCIRPSQD